MKTAIKLTSVVMAIAFCASAFADPSKNVVQQPSKQKQTRKACFAMVTTSGIPTPCDRLGVIPTTDQQMDVLGSRAGK